ncbi:3-dehydroquinate synthase [Helicobacter sp.]|uniref:3-dehydroquinate synthase n=1 Tax=Helicobacter sp. TaxID=218 RepID=UPI0025C732FD|nr:3-dehydroquinate synthase [Helicobacter sp.]MCI5968451.1 3-dehydroquinate synthase [Helicobacter sp.]MDY2585236.1 3-dehydroquinate synthase [Helicobacter sp.]
MESKIHLPHYTISFGKLPKLAFDTKVLIVTNPKIAGLHLPTLLAKLQAKEVYCHTIADGEIYKDFKSVESILEAAFNHRLDRKSLMIALGGGVIGDVVGFAAGIFMRGIDFIQIPTTLLAQVDSSVGGKTGINNAFGKNLIGLFHQPKAVFIDAQFLHTLPQRELSAGLAEVVKKAVCFDKNFFKVLEELDCKDESALLAVIQKAVGIKAQVVREDEKEQGIRAALNYGHTFGHSIELESGYGKFLHGEAVGIGMVMANTLALALNLITQKEFDAIKALLEKFRIPTDYAIKNVESFYGNFFLDKKSLNSRIKFILPKSIGGVCFKNDIPKALVLDVLREFA